MDKYHIFEEIGKGTFSQVFKGREKKKIEYVAIKRVDKTMMSKVVNEVQIIHKLESPHTLRFFDWYETKNNLWLILEYCTGADLQTLLQQDGHLPETSVRTFGMDVMSGLKYMHSLGLLHCDLKPSNFLIDEFGILKFCDFKYARKLPKSLLDEKGTVQSRGYVPYLAPELVGTNLFVHSFYSDIWSLGCLLYELRKGVKPFGHVDINALHQQYLFEHSEHAGQFQLDGQGGEDAEKKTSPIENEALSNDILKKSNEYRLLVANICDVEPVHHPVDTGGPQHDLSTITSAGTPQRRMPQQQHTSRTPSPNKSTRQSQHSQHGLPPCSLEFADMLLWMMEKNPIERSTWNELIRHPFWAADRSNDQDAQPTKRMQDVTLPSHATFDAHISKYNRLKLEEMAAKSMSEQTTPGSHSMGASDGKGEKKSGGLNPKPLAMYASPTVKTPHTPGTSSIPITSSNPPSKATPRQTPPGATPDSKPTHSAHSTVGNSPQTGHRQAEAASLFPESHHFDADEEDGIVNVATIMDSNTSILCDMNGLLWHPSDSQVKPIVGNKAIEVIEKTSYKTTGILPAGTAVMSAAEVNQLPLEELEQYLTQVYRCLYKICAHSNPNSQNQNSSGTSPSPPQSSSAIEKEKLNVLSYICSLAACGEVANIILNTHFLGILLKLVKIPVTPNYSTAATSIYSSRTMAITLVALVLRHATNIIPPTTTKARDEHVLPILLSLLKQEAFGFPPPSPVPTLLPSSSKTAHMQQHTSLQASQALLAQQQQLMRRRCMAAFGEMVFYITSQDDEEDRERMLHDQASAPPTWVLPVGAVGILFRGLKDDTDSVVRFYAAKTIENVLSQGSLEYQQRFATFEIATRLAALSLLPTSGGNLMVQQEQNLQVTCGTALAQIIRIISIHGPLVAPSSGPSSASATAGSKGKVNSKVEVKGISGISGPVLGSASEKGRGNSNATTPPANRSASSKNTPSPSSAGTGRSPPTTQPAASGASGRFISRVLEKGGILPGILDSLRDGQQQPKLQQAYLTMINIVFCSRLSDDYKKTEECDNSKEESRQDDASCGTERSGYKHKPISTNFTPSDVALRSVRQFFLKHTSSVSFLNIALCLMEQSPSLVVRGKALCAVQLLCVFHPPMLNVVCEKRVPGSLVRLIEPISSHPMSSVQENGSNRHDADNEHENYIMEMIASSFPLQSALSFLKYVSLQLLHVTDALATQLNMLINVVKHGTNSSSTEAGEYVGTDTPSKSPGRDLKHSRASPSPSLVRQQTPQTAPTAAVTVPKSAVPNYAQITKHCEELRALISIASHPSLRKFITDYSSEYIMSIAAALKLIMEARHTFSVYKEMLETNVDTMQSVSAIEQCVLLAVEMISQIDLSSAGGADDFQEQTECKILSSPQRRVRGGSMMVAVDPFSVCAILDALLQWFIPAVLSSFAHMDGTVRVTACAALRRLFPTVIRAMWYKVNIPSSAQSNRKGGQGVAVTNNIALLEKLSPSLSELRHFLVRVPVLMRDDAPIPQYAIRLLLDCSNISPLLCLTVGKELAQVGGLHSLVMSMNTGVSAQLSSRSPYRGTPPRSGKREGDRAVSDVMTMDPQLPVLLKCFFEAHVDLAVSMMQIGVCRQIESCLLLVAEQSHWELLVSILEFLVVITHHLLRTHVYRQHQQGSPARARHGESVESGQMEWEEMIAPFSIIVPSLFSVLQHCVSVQSARSAGFQSPGGTYSSSNIELAYRASDLTTQCLTIFFDILPTVVISSMVVPTSSHRQQRSERDGSPGSSTPNAGAIKVIANMLLHEEYGHISTRLLKLLMTVATFVNNNKATHLSMWHDVKYMLQQSPVHEALKELGRQKSNASSAAASPARGQPIDAPEQASIVRHLVSLAAAMV